MVPVHQDDGEVGEEDEEVGDDVADNQEGPGVDHVSLTGGQEVHRTWEQITLVHISAMSQYYLLFYWISLVIVMLQDICHS